MSEGTNQTKVNNYPRSKRATCIACTNRKQCVLPMKDTEDEDTSLYNCSKFKPGSQPG
jgi:hypothetical protein